MAKVTSKLQVTLPKAIAEQYDIHPGDEIDWVPAGDVIRVIPPGKKVAADDRAAKLRMFDQATERHRRRRTVTMSTGSAVTRSLKRRKTRSGWKTCTAIRQRCVSPRLKPAKS